MEERESRVIRVEVSHEMKTSYLNYAMSVIVSRALPDVRDGLKPVHRRILYDMYEMGLRANTPFKKAARVVGDVLGKYHPHGDASVYDALVRLAQDFSLRYPVVRPQGNFGSIDGDPPAAMRYTEVKMSRIGEEMLADIQKETVDFGPNYDDSLQEPLVLPAAFPFMLANGSSGIAVGMATNMAPHNLTEICDAIAAVIENPEIELDGIMQYIKGPDFPSGAIICGQKGIREAFATGRGKIVQRACYEIEEHEKGADQIIFTQIPYQVNKAELVKKMDELRRNDLPAISAVRDESDREGIRIVVELKKGSVPRIVLNSLFLRTPLQSNFNVNNLALVDGRPQLLPLKQILVHYIDYREQVVERRTRYDLKKAEERAHILKGLKIGLDNIDEVIRIIKESEDNAVASEGLQKAFGLDKIQADAIIDMKLGRLSHLETSKILEELAELEVKIAYYKDLLSDRRKILGVVEQETRELSAKYGDKRRTEIQIAEIGQTQIEDFIKNEEVVVVVSHKGFIKRVVAEEYRSQGRGGSGVKGARLVDDDFVEHLYVASTHDYVMFVSSFGKAYWIKVHEIPEGSKISKGSSIKQLIDIEDGEEISSIINFTEFSEDQYLFMVTKYGVTKKVALAAFRNAKMRGVRALFLDEGDIMVQSELMTDGDDMMFVTAGGRGLRISGSDVRAMGRASRGVRGMKLLGEDTIVGLLKVDDNKRILMVTEKGQGKQVHFNNFNRHGRGTQGQLIYRIKEKTSYLVNALAVNDENDVVVITLQGQTIRIHVNQISIQGRNASGVRVVSLRKDSDSIVAIAITEYAKDEEEEILEDGSVQPVENSEESSSAEIVNDDKLNE